MKNILPHINTTFKLVYQENNPDNIPYIKIIGYIFNSVVYTDLSLLKKVIDSKTDDVNIELIYYWEKYLPLADEYRSGSKIESIHWWNAMQEYIKEIK